MEDGFVPTGGKAESLNDNTDTSGVVIHDSATTVDTMPFVPQPVAEAYPGDLSTNGIVDANNMYNYLVTNFYKKAVTVLNGTENLNAISDPGYYQADFTTTAQTSTGLGYPDQVINVNHIAFIEQNNTANTMFAADTVGIQTYYVFTGTGISSILDFQLYSRLITSIGATPWQLISGSGGGGGMMIPDYGNMETTNRIPTTGSSWIVDRDEFVADRPIF